MSRFNRPRSLGEPIAGRRSRARRFPWLYNFRKLTTPGHTCEACKLPATAVIEYEWLREQAEVTSVFLCDTHAHMTLRAGGLDRIQQLINKKVESQK